MLKREPRVYVYPNTVAACTNHRQDKDLFEPKLAAFFSQHLRATTPAEADLFYHPACLTDLYFRVRNQHNGTAVLRAAEEAILSQIDALGFAHRPHAVNALRCRTIRWQDERSHIVRALPRLWGSGRFVRFCAEAMHAVDTARSVHLPYCARAPASAASRLEPFSARARSTRVLFIGSFLYSRKRVLRGLHSQNISRRIVILNPFRRASPGRLWCDAWHPLHTYCPDGGVARHRRSRLAYNRGKGVRSADVYRTMADATYTLCPAGDAPDSPRVYSALAHGSVPLLDPATQPPPLLNWSLISAPIRFEGGVLQLPSPAEEAALLRNVWTHRFDFECEATNPAFAAYLAAAVARVSGAAARLATPTFPYKPGVSGGSL